MKAAVYDRYGPAENVTIRDIPRPQIADTEILVEVCASAVSTADWRIRASEFPAFAWVPGRLMFGVFRPRNKVLGTDFSGSVAAVGAAVTRFAVGDEVFGFSGRGAHAEYLTVSQDAAVVRKPAGITHEEAAAVPFGAQAALVFLRDFAKLQAGERALVIGASGGVGVFAVQLARHFGAEVTAVGGKDSGDLLRRLGAAETIDYTSQDHTRPARPYDVILGTIRGPRIGVVKRMLSRAGRYVPLEFGFREILHALLGRVTGGPDIRIGVSSDTAEDLAIIAGLLESGEIVPVIDSVYPLARIAEAHRRVETRHKRGAVVISIADDAPGTGVSAA